ncbi:MAG: DUF3576 domain-containing protein [Proteobacteria bacterium]|nr:DUF3576 domain-containing protein [Pseudomonadota bacterium]
MRLNIAIFIAPVILTGLISALGACGYFDPDQVLVTNPKTSRGPNAGTSVFGEGGINFFGNAGEEEAGGGGAGIGVNSHLWRASLDTISFMPLSSADPFGGVIITDWYAPPDSPSERFKMTIFILDRALRADGLRVAVFRQQQSDKGDWIDSSINPSTVTSLENKILERARQLRTGGIGE